MADKPEREEALRGLPVPKDIESKVRRGREDMRRDADIRRQAQKFFQNEPYWYIKAKGGLGVLPTAIDAVDKANYRIRKKLNLIPEMVQRKVSAATQRIPGFQVDPSTADQQARASARLSEQALYYGYEDSHMRRMSVKTVTTALVKRGGGFAMPYWDPNVGPFKNGKGQGKIKFLTLSRDEVGWEPGTDFEDSPWYIVVQAQLTEEVKKLPGFVGGDPPKNAMLMDTPEGKRSDEMTEVTMFFERPCPDYPEGRLCYIADDQIIVDNRKIDSASEYWWEDYPYRDENDKVVDEPCIHRITYTVDPENDDMGLVEVLIDPQLTVLDCWNKILELKNRALMLQMIAPNGSKMPPRDDTPGATYFYNVVGGQTPQWEPAPDPAYLSQLIQVLEQAKLEMRAMAGDIDVNPEPNLAAKTLNASIEQAQAQWQVFLGDVESWWGRIGHHYLTLAARHWNRDKVIQMRGTYGWEPDRALTGEDLHSQVNVRILPGSIEAKSRSQTMEEIQLIQTLWPGAISPEVAMAALHGGNADSLFRTYDTHVARAWALIQSLREAPDEVFNVNDRQDFEVGDPALQFMVPGWMPRPQDNIVIWKEVLASYMITPDFQEQKPEIQQAFDEVWSGLEYYEQLKLMKMAQQEQNAAADLGAANAAKPQGVIQGPQPQAGLQTPDQAAPSAGTPE